MKPEYEEPIHGRPQDSWRLGIGSWDERAKGGAESDKSLKYVWETASGRVPRGGEIPLYALPQAIEFAISYGNDYLDAASVLEAVARGLRRSNNAIQ